MMGYGYGGWNQCGNVQPNYCQGGNNSSTFVLIVVLFILLIIVGASFL